MATKRRALISVSDKRYITTFARDLIKLDYELISTGGTYKKLKQAKIPCKEVSRVYNTTEMLDGRVKTLHPHIMAGILADSSNDKHMKELKSKRIVPIDMVVVNFYPFHEKVKPGKTPVPTAIELIDIGGPSMVRAASKNYKSVIVLSDIEQYRQIIRELKDGEGELSPEYRMWLAGEAFRLTSEYEQAVSAYFKYVSVDPTTEEEEDISVADADMPAEILPAKLTLELSKAQPLRYGENPHQDAARYIVKGLPILGFKILQGKEMSYNNYLDAAAVTDTMSAQYTRKYAACVVKHLNPCGIAVGDDPVKTFINAREADPQSAFGGIVGLNYEVDEKLAKELRKTFLEIIVAPSFTKEALSELGTKKNLRLVEVDLDSNIRLQASSPRLYATQFGILLQSYDVVQENWEELQLVSATEPPEKLKEDILLGLTFVRFIKSNSLCIVKDGVMIGRGVGQMSRVDAAEQALASAGNKAKGAVLVSDGFFPFADSLELAAKAKIACVVAPAGSKRDMEVVAAADKLKLPLIFAPHRHFRH